MTEKELMKPCDVAEILGFSSAYVRTLIREGRIPAMVAGKREQFINRQAFWDWTYFASLTNQKKIVEHIGVDYEEMMRWIIAFRNYRDMAETELLKSAKSALEELRKVYISKEAEPDVDVIKHFEAAIGKVEVFDPEAILQRTVS